jgi:hypothetical protein
MDHYSRKYEKWYRCIEANRHPRSLYLYRFGDYYYRPDKDMLIHISFVEEYIDKCKKVSNKYKKDAYCKKNGIEIKD